VADTGWSFQKPGQGKNYLCPEHRVGSGRENIPVKRDVEEEREDIAPRKRGKPMAADKDEGKLNQSRAVDVPAPVLQCKVLNLEGLPATAVSTASLFDNQAIQNAGPAAW
jgi:hypothetical protein